MEPVELRSVEASLYSDSWLLKRDERERREKERRLKSKRMEAEEEGWKVEEDGTRYGDERADGQWVSGRDPLNS